MRLSSWTLEIWWPRSRRTRADHGGVSLGQKRDFAFGGISESRAFERGATDSRRAIVGSLRQRPHGARGRPRERVCIATGKAEPGNGSVRSLEAGVAAARNARPGIGYPTWRVIGCPTFGQYGPSLPERWDANLITRYPGQRRPRASGVALREGIAILSASIAGAERGAMRSLYEQVMEHAEIKPICPAAPFPFARRGLVGRPLFRSFLAGRLDQVRVGTTCALRTDPSGLTTPQPASTRPSRSMSPSTRGIAAFRSESDVPPPRDWPEPHAALLTP